MARTSALITPHPMGWHPPGLLLIPFRYLVTGYPILPPRDNASFLYDATEDYRHKPIPKLSKARWRRVARRNGAITVPLVLLALTPTSWVSLWAVWSWLILVLLAGLAWLGWRGIVRLRVHNPWRFFRDRRVRAEFIDPAAEVLVRILGQRYIRSRARRMIELPHGWGTGEAVDDGAPKVARVWLPAGTTLEPGVKKRITEQVGARLGIPSPVGDWRESGPTPFVDIQGAPTPPREVLWSSLLPAIAKCAEDEVILGRIPGGRFLMVSASEDSPHFAMSGPSGTGKSVLGKVFLVQRLHRGDGVFILDPKKWSHWRWAGGGKMPQDRVVYAYKTEDIHNAWIAIAQEGERRIELDEEELAVQRRVWIVVEEINTATKRLTRWWTQERKRRMTKAKALLKQAQTLMDESELDLDEAAAAVGLDLAELDLPATSPAVVAMQESVGMGRELKMHVLVMAQRLSASVFGGNGGDIRESFQGGRFIARWDRKLWKMLVDTLAYVACPTGPRGIWGVAQGEDFTVFRVPFLTDREATAYALGGAAVHGPVLGPQEGHATLEGESWSGGEVDGQTERPALTAAVTLADALHLLPGQSGPAAISEAALRRASTRDKSFPEPLAKPDGQPYGRTEAKIYDLDQLVEWAMARNGGGQ
jgi:hypothetical protein